LATIHLVGRGHVLGCQWRQLAADIDQVLIAPRPVVEESEFLDDFLLHALDVGCVHQLAIFQRVPCGPSSIATPMAASSSRIASARAKSRAARAARRASIKLSTCAESTCSAPRLNQVSGSCCNKPSISPPASSAALA